MLKEQGGDTLFDLVEKDRRLSIRRRAGDKEAAAELSVQLRGRAPQVARDLARAFSMWFRSVNLAEKVHRIRRRRGYFIEASERAQPGGVEAALTELKNRGFTLVQVLELLKKIRIEPVFTAHPTESARRTMLRKNQRIAELLLDRLDPTLTPQELRQNWSRVRTELTTAWQTEDHPRERLTVADEREHVVFYLAEILYRILPAFYDELAEALARLYGVHPDSLELPNMIRFGTWVGGDMDGNPDVHAKTIRDTLARQQQVIINAYFKECGVLAQLLSQSGSRSAVNPELSQRIELYATLIPGALGITPMRHDRMPYRVFLGQVSERLRLTYDRRPNGYEGPQQFLRDLKLITASLKANKGFHAGWGNVQRLIRRVETFGFHLATLDLRQHAEIHHRVIGQGLDDPHWMTRTPAERHDLLVQAIERDAGVKMELDALGRRTLGVFEAHPAGAASLRAGRHRLLRGERHAERGRRAGAAAAGALGGSLRPRLRRSGRGHRAAVRVRRIAGTLRRRHENLVRRSAVPAASRCPRPHAVRARRLFGRQQGERHLRRAVRRLPRAGGSLHRARRGQRAPRHFPCARRQHRARRLAHRFPGAHGAGRNRERRAAPDRAGRSHQPELWAQAHRHAHDGARLQRAGAVARWRGHRQRAERRAVAVRGAAGHGQPPGLPALRAWRRRTSMPGSRR